jgi:hypothetical protein
MPISTVRRATVYDSTPYAPTAASTVASAANNARSVVLKRHCWSDLPTIEFIVASRSIG